MAQKYSTALCALIIIVSMTSYIKGAPRHSRHVSSLKSNEISHKHLTNAQSRSYIDIDASDPFKVPKSSQYVDQPVPEFSHNTDEKDNSEVEEEHVPENSSEHESEHEEGDNLPIKNFDNIQDDLKQMGLEKLDKPSSMEYNDKETAEEQQQQPVIEQEGAASNDPGKPIEIGDVDQSLKGLGEAQSRHNTPSYDEKGESEPQEGHGEHSEDEHTTEDV